MNAFCGSPPNLYTGKEDKAISILHKNSSE